jgi:outer membrane immunogenic protein
MKLIALAVSILAASIGVASAADLAARPYTKAPPPVAVAAYNWSGFYLGANGGGAWSRKCWDANPYTIDVGLIPPFTIQGPEGCHTASGATAGGQIGYRWQSAAWVFGLEAQGNWADLTGSNASQLFPFAGNGVTNRTRIDAIGLFTGQVGYTWNSFLLYVKGGAAVVRDKYDVQITGPGSGLPIGFVAATGSETRWGAAVGVGGEYAFTPNWSFGLEYNHLFMGSRDVRLTYDPAGFIAQFNHNERIRQDVDMVTARLNYRFGGPVVAKY